MRLLVRWLILSLTILMIPSLIPGIQVRDFGTALAAAAVLAVLNVLVKPLLILLTLPLTLLTLGLFLLVINALIFQFAGALVGGLHIASFWSALGGSLLVSIVSWFTSSAGDRRVVYIRGSRSANRDGRTLDLDRGGDGKWY